MVERKQRMTTALSAVLLILAVVLLVIGVRYITMGLIKIIVFWILGMWIIARTL